MRLVSRPVHRARTRNELRSERAGRPGGRGRFVDPLAPGALLGFEWTSASTDNTPNFDVTFLTTGGAPLEHTAGMFLLIESSPGVEYLLHEIAAGDLIGGAFDATAGALADGSYASFRARVQLAAAANPGPWLTVTDGPVVIDATAPTVSTIAFSSSPAVGDTFAAAENIDVTVTFNEAVIVVTTGGTPAVTVTVGASAKTAAYVSGSGTTALVFRYTIQSGDADADGISISANQLALNSGTIKDAAGNNATLTHSAVTTDANRKVATASNNLLTGLVSYWKMDEASGNAIDAHGTNDLTDNNTVGTLTGKIGDCRDFSGTNEYFSHADNADLSVDGTSFSFAFWVNLDSVTGLRALISKRDEAGTGEFVIYANAGGGGNAPQFFNYTSGFNGVIASTFGALSTGTWYLLACVADDAAKELRISVNAGTQNVASYTGSVGATTHTFRIGVEQSEVADVDGKIDETGFWKRALSTSDITAIYNSGNGLSYDNFT